MNKWLRRINYFILLVLAVSCAQESKKDGQAPPVMGEVEYEVSYSKDIFDNFVVGQFLPRRVTGLYNKNGIKLNVSCGFGMLNMNVVLSPIDSYLDIQLPDNHVLLPVSKLILQDSIDAYNCKVFVEHNDTIVNVMGYDSKSMKVRLEYDNYDNRFGSNPGEIEVFYIPIEGIDYSIEGLPGFTVPGLITAMKMHNEEDKSLMLMLSKIKDKTVDDMLFVRPRDAIEIDVNELIAMKSMVEMNQ